MGWAGGGDAGIPVREDGLPPSEKTKIFVGVTCTVSRNLELPPVPCSGGALVEFFARPPYCSVSLASHAILHAGRAAPQPRECPLHAPGGPSGRPRRLPSPGGSLFPHRRPCGAHERS